MPLVSSSLRTICEHWKCNISQLAAAAGIHASSLSRILNGIDDMSWKLLHKLSALDNLSDDDAAMLAEDWTLDHWPPRAKALLLIQRRRAPDEDSGASRLSEQPPTLPDDELTKLMQTLHQRARENPALARAFRNLLNSLEGKTEVAE